jgi:hypothetical protein
VWPVSIRRRAVISDALWWNFGWTAQCAGTEGLNGARAEGGRVTINLLAFHISQGVKELT